MTANRWASLDSASSEKSYAGPAWDNTPEYKSLTTPDFQSDFAAVVKLIAEIQVYADRVGKSIAGAEKLSPETAKANVEDCQKVAPLRNKVTELLYSLDAYSHCEISVDGKNENAKRMVSQLQSTGAQLSQALAPVNLFLLRVSDKVVEAYLKHPDTKSEEYKLRHERRLRSQLLSLEEENLLTAMSVNGFTAWGNLYSNIASGLVCEIDLPDGKKKVGMAEATGYLRNADPVVRKNAYEARNAAWSGAEDSCALALNSISGWRIDEFKKRSHSKPVHFLDVPLHESRIEKSTLESMFNAVKDGAHIAHKALHLSAQILGKTKLEAWDLSAPAPRLSSDPAAKYSFDTGLKMVADAFSEVSPEMGSFVNMMKEKKWIEGRILPTKRHGAYCTGFQKSRTPRVYMTYMGSSGDIQTLAHELGHAFHFWVMRDLPVAEQSVPMTLAETASIFAETVSCDALAAAAKNRDEEFQAAWMDAQSAASFLLNIPARFEFEKKFHEQRAEKTLSADELKELSRSHMQSHYGESADMGGATMTWASTLHYYITELGFYNFPYTFGYLFSLGVYAQWKKRGAKFFEAYVSLLKDTGRMSAEDLIQKHLSMDITKQEFWNDSIKIVAQKVDRFEHLCNLIIAEDDRR